MNNRNSDRNLGRFLSLLRETPLAGPAYTPEELRRMISTESPLPSPQKSVMARRVLPLLVVGGLAALFLAYQPESDPVAGRVPASAPVVVKKDANGSAAHQQHPRLAQSGSIENPQQIPSAPAVTSSRSGVRMMDRTTSNLRITADNPGEGLRENSANISIPDNTSRPHSSLPSESRTENSPSQAVSNVNIPGLKMIELNAGELADIGVNVRGERIEILTEERFTPEEFQELKISEQNHDDIQHFTSFKRWKVVLDTSAFDSKRIDVSSASATHLKIAPVAILWKSMFANPQHQGRFVTYENSPLLDTAALFEENLSADDLARLYGCQSNYDNVADVTSKMPGMRNLIPIHIRLGARSIEGTTRRRECDLYLWYVPTREFVAALPERYRGQLQRELDIMAEVESMNIPAEKACAHLTGEAMFFDLCRSSSGAVASAAVHPNSATGKGRCWFRLGAPRGVWLTLHDIAGAHIRNLSTPGAFGDGSHEMELDLTGLSSGTYLVAIRTDHGEQVVQRVMVQ